MGGGSLQRSEQMMRLVFEVVVEYRSGVSVFVVVLVYCHGCLRFAALVVVLLRLLGHGTRWSGRQPTVGGREAVKAIVNRAELA